MYFHKKQIRVLIALLWIQLVSVTVQPNFHVFPIVMKMFQAILF